MRSLQISIGAVTLWLALVAGMSSPPAASAAEIGNGYYYGEGSEQNDVTVSYDAGTGTYTLTDTGVVTISNPDVSCSVVGNVATCPAPYSPDWVDLGDGADQFTMLGAAPGFRPRVYGQGGSDTIDLSRVVTTVPDAGYLLGDGETYSVSDGDDVIYAGDSTAPRIAFQMRGGAGADQLYGGSGNDWLIDDYPVNTGPSGFVDTIGEPDVLDGGGGADQLEAYNGADTLRGGPGDDLVNPWLGAAFFPLPPDDGFIDSNSCGPDEDKVALGPGDSMTADCEIVTQVTSCPDGAPGPCLNTLVASAPAPVTASGASAAKAGRRVRLAKPKTIQVAPGWSKAVTLRLMRRAKRRALRGRRKVRARMVAKRKIRNKPRRRVRGERTPFLLKRR